MEYSDNIALMLVIFVIGGSVSKYMGHTELKTMTIAIVVAVLFVGFNITRAIEALK